MSFICGLIALACASLSLFLAPDPIARAAIAFSLIAISAPGRGVSARSSLGFAVLYVAGLAVFAKLGVSGSGPIDLAAGGSFLRQALIDAAPLLGFLGLAGVVLRMDLESLLNTALRVPGLRPGAILLAAAAAQLVYLKYLTPTVWQGQWGRGSLRTDRPWRRVLGLARISIPLAVNFIIDSERRGEVAEAGPPLRDLRPAPAPLFRSRDPIYLVAYLVTGTAAVWMRRHV